MPSQYPHGHAYDLFVSYSTTNLEWVRAFHDDLIKDVNQLADFDVYPFLDIIRTGFSPAMFGMKNSSPLPVTRPYLCRYSRRVSS